MPITQNKHLVAAYKDYMDALAAQQQGLIGNASRQREVLRAVYRRLAGK